eukprot:2158439-Prymnesium_polylepis.1
MTVRTHSSRMKLPDALGMSASASMRWGNRASQPDRSAWGRIGGSGSICLFAGISLALSDSWELSDSLYDGTDRGGGGGGVAAGDRCAALSA